MAYQNKYSSNAVNISNRESQVDITLHVMWWDEYMCSVDRRSKNVKSAGVHHRYSQGELQPTEVQETSHTKETQCITSGKKDQQYSWRVDCMKGLSAVNAPNVWN